MMKYTPEMRAYVAERLAAKWSPAEIAGAMYARFPHLGEVTARQVYYLSHSLRQKPEKCTAPPISLVGPAWSVPAGGVAVQDGRAG